MTRELADRVEMTTPGQNGRVSSKVEQLILRRQESNLRPPGYEPGELTAAPRRTRSIPPPRPNGKPFSANSPRSTPSRPESLRRSPSSLRPSAPLAKPYVRGAQIALSGRNTSEPFYKSGTMSQHPSFQLYLDHLRVERRASPHTLRGYSEDLALFGRFLSGNNGCAIDPTTISSKHLRSYATWLGGQSYAPSTIARRLAASGPTTDTSAAGAI